MSDEPTITIRLQSGVDVGQFVSFTLAEGREVTIWNETEYPAGYPVWYRLAPHMTGCVACS